MNLSAFMAKNALPAENVKFAPSTRFLDENKQPILWEIRPISGAEDEALRKGCKKQVPIPGRKGQYQRETDYDLYTGKLAAACTCFAQAGCSFAVVELPDAGLAPALPQMPVCAVTHIGPDESGRSLERLAHDAAAVLREGSICVTAPDQPKAALTEIIVAAGKTNCELVVPDAEDIKFLKAHRFASQIDYGGYEAPLAFLGRHAACNAAV